LYFYKARWFRPVLGSFIQPDSIVPNNYNPLDLDRYSYVRNNPVRYIDPSGHLPCFEDGYCPDKRYSESDHLKHLARRYGIKFTGTWEIANQWAVVAGVEALAFGFAYAMGSAAQPALAFRDVYGIRGNVKFNFEWGCSDCTKLGYTVDARHIKFRQMYEEAKYLNRTAADALFMNTTLVVHELIHSFEYAMQIRLEDGTLYKEARSTLPSTFTRAGLADAYEVWYQSDDPGSGEIFADMGIAWTYNHWNTDPTLSVNMIRWMIDRMPDFIDKAIDNQR
jgi:hypothetical protein